MCVCMCVCVCSVYVHLCACMHVCVSVCDAFYASPYVPKYIICGSQQLCTLDLSIHICVDSKDPAQSFKLV